ncbi:MAG: MTH1187 family thiamine-binding protein [Blastocatellia bacterium]|nr:MTH1187 family thiamine-binding protein [Blastocatellia bacterium]MCS7158533.1 MTH1187 family thiamine-binding protein [Blastocatellia bacterium]MDW8169342.1 MTH1187 family thiamine-binding protein [Acidobacteriota bacterium]MDW8257729.1 MTH1187 family thiamine-binding protein [Acidobacteriota bacterium]
MALVEVSVVPIGTGTPSLGDHIAAAVRVLEKAGVPYEISPMGTLFEGELRDIFSLARKMHEAAFRHGAQRVITTITIDDRRDKSVTMRSKVASVKRRLARK